MGQAGGKATLQRLVNDHYPALYRYAFRLCGTADTAADLTQETFCKAQAQFAQLRQPDRPRPWLFGILRNAYLHRLRADRSHREVPLEWAAHVGRDDADPIPEFDPRRLQDALNEMPEAFRTPIILFYFEEFSYREIADQMDVPIGTVMSRLARGKAFLRQRLAEPNSDHRMEH